MPGANLLSRTLIAIALGVAAMLFAATGADAHPGHDHASHAGPTAAHHAAAVHHAPTDIDALHVRHRATDALQGSNPGHASLTALAGGQGAPRSTDLCASGCCHMGGAGCCGAWLPPVNLLPDPPDSRFVIDRTSLGGAGVTPDTLPEPPNSLA